MFCSVPLRLEGTVAAKGHSSLESLLLFRIMLVPILDYRYVYIIYIYTPTCLEQETYAVPIVPSLYKIRKKIIKEGASIDMLLFIELRSLHVT
jgi:hypothetical protein